MLEAWPACREVAHRELAYRRLRHRLPALLTLALIAAFGCGEPKWQTSYRLERSFALAQTYWDTDSIDVGTDEGRVWLLDGWSWNESNEAGETFSWSNGRASTFGLMVFEAQDSVLHLRGFPFPSEPSDTVDPLSIAVSVGGAEHQDRSLGQVVLENGMTESTLAFPAEYLRQGRNDLTFRYNWIRSDLPSQATNRWNRAQRDLGVAWSSISLASAGIPPRPARTGAPPSSTDLVSRSLNLAVGSWSEYELELEAGSRITVSGIECAACGPSSVVEVYLGGLERTHITKIGTLSDKSKTLSLLAPSLGQKPTAPTHTLILRVPEARDGEPSDGFVTLEAPRIERPIDATAR